MSLRVDRGCDVHCTANPPFSKRYSLLSVPCAQHLCSGVPVPPPSRCRIRKLPAFNVQRGCSPRRTPIGAEQKFSLAKGKAAVCRSNAKKELYTRIAASETVCEGADWDDVEGTGVGSIPVNLPDKFLTLVLILATSAIVDAETTRWMSLDPSRSHSCKSGCGFETNWRLLWWLFCLKGRCDEPFCLTGQAKTCLAGQAGCLRSQAAMRFGMRGVRVRQWVPTGHRGQQHRKEKLSLLLKHLMTR